jgi:hypothetical protein
METSSRAIAELGQMKDEPPSTRALQKDSLQQEFDEPHLETGNS